MKPILAIVHIYYPRMWPEVRDCLASITYPCDIYVTMVQGNSELKREILAFNPNIKIKVVENRGYDVGPFVEVLNTINLDNYSYLVKLHTKRDIAAGARTLRGMSGDKWRKALLYPFQTKGIFKQYIKYFEQNPAVGMQAYYPTVLSSKTWANKKDQIMFGEFIERRNLANIDYKFVAGTMFIARANLLKNLQEFKLKITDFPEPTAGHSIQLAHVLERFFGYCVYAHGFIVTDGLCSIQKQFLFKLYFALDFVFLSFFRRFLFQKKITNSGKKCIKICKIQLPQALVGKVWK